MKSAILLLLSACLTASTPSDLLQSLERFPCNGGVVKRIHVESRAEHPSQPKESPRESHQDFGLRFENGELWAQKTAGSDELTEQDLRQILDPRPLIREWLKSDPNQASTPQKAEPLVLSVKPKTPARLKRLWEAEGTLQLWFTPDGTPSRAVLSQRYKGRVQRIAPTEEVIVKTEYTFKTEGDHLLIIRTEEDREEHDGYDVVKRHRVLELRD